MSKAEACARFLELVRAGDVARVAEMLETQPVSTPPAGVLLAAVRSGATCSTAMVGLLLENGAQFPDRTLYDACTSAVEPQVFASLARWEIELLPPTMRFRATATSDCDGSIAALMAVGGKSALNVQLVSFLLGWDEETEPDASEGRRAFQRLGVLAEAAVSPIDVEQELMQELVALPKMHEALAFVERSVVAGVERLHPDAVRCVCELRHTFNEACTQGWDQLVLDLVAEAPTVMREAIFVCLRGGLSRANEEIQAVGKQFLRDVRWTSVRSLFLVRRRLREKRADDPHPLAALSEPLFRLVVEFCREGMNVSQLLKQCSLGASCWCREEYGGCECHNPSVGKALEFADRMWQ